MVMSLRCLTFGTSGIGHPQKSRTGPSEDLTRPTGCRKLLPATRAASTLPALLRSGKGAVGTQPRLAAGVFGDLRRAFRARSHLSLYSTARLCEVRSGCESGTHGSVLTTPVSQTHGATLESTQLSTPTTYTRALNDERTPCLPCGLGQAHWRSMPMHSGGLWRPTPSCRRRTSKKSSSGTLSDCPKERSSGQETTS